jgi:hypothetical protein
MIELEQLGKAMAALQWLRSDPSAGTACKSYARIGCFDASITPQSHHPHLHPVIISRNSIERYAR